MLTLLIFDCFLGQTAAAGYTGGYDQTAAAAKPATYATTYTQRTGQQQAQAAVSYYFLLKKSVLLLLPIFYKNIPKLIYFWLLILNRDNLMCKKLADQ